MTDHESTGFLARHLGPRPQEMATMLSALNMTSLEQLSERVVPESIRDMSDLTLPERLFEPLSEEAALKELQAIASKNVLKQNLIGQGYHGTYTPQVILRNILLSPGWYTAYTPYQPEISQGRLEVLFNFQTMITELTGLDIANASMLDEGTAAAEAMTLCHRTLRGKRNTFLVSKYCHPQTIAVIETRAQPMGFEVVLFDEASLPTDRLADTFAVLFQYPRTDGELIDYTALSEEIHGAGSMVIVAADPLAMTLLKSPAMIGADVAVGSTQRFGVPLGFGGPHAAYMATKDKYKRSLPGRLVGLSHDAENRPCYRLALQTREQHIRREKATSNICTAQALLAIMATMYAAYHGAHGLRMIAQNVADATAKLHAALCELGYSVSTQSSFDSLVVSTGADTATLHALAVEAGFNLRHFSETEISISMDETVDIACLQQLVDVFAAHKKSSLNLSEIKYSALINSELLRPDLPLEHQVAFNQYHSETEMMRYLRRMADRDIALDRAMIPLGSCTMKLNAASEMAPVTWPEFANMHPFAPEDQTQGYQQMIDELDQMLCASTGYDAMSLQPNAGSQGEYAGLLAIKRYLEATNQGARNICLIPTSAHGTNPASAQMLGMKVVTVACDSDGNVDVDDLKTKIEKHTGKVAAIMITYPSTHGVFESKVTEVCELVHQEGGQVYIDGANLNAQIGLSRPGWYGGDVSHLNLHKTFCIPHGGGGPGVGPIGVREHLKPFLPGHIAWDKKSDGVSAAPYGSASILPITWMYCRMMGGHGLQKASQVALLNANYMAKRLEAKYEILYRGENDTVAHECILDVRPLKDSVGVTVDDIAKRLIDFGFHAPTMSFPVAGTLMIEPTESESLQEIDRFCDAMLLIYDEYEAIKQGKIDYDKSPLHFAPHTAYDLLNPEWDRSYPARQGAYPAGYDLKVQKYWPPVARVDNVFGDKNLICSCPPLSAYED